MESGSTKADRYSRWAVIAVWTFVIIALARTAAAYLLSSWTEPWWVAGLYYASLVPMAVFSLLARRERAKRS